ncbi:MAG TPA: DNA polymerase III subunit gamma/tau, partial [Parasegetibacter sp.]
PKLTIEVKNPQQRITEPVNNTKSAQAQPKNYSQPVSQQNIAVQEPAAKFNKSLDDIRQAVKTKLGSQAANNIAVTLTPENLNAAWQEYIEQLKEARNPAAQSFGLAELRIQSNDLFHIITGNNLEQKFVESERIKLSEFLQQRFNNRKLLFSIEIEERDEAQTAIERPLSTRAQYNKLVEHYPLINELRQRLRLELD